MATGGYHRPRVPGYSKQLELVQLLLRPDSPNITVVGDEREARREDEREEAAGSERDGDGVRGVVAREEAAEAGVVVIGGHTVSGTQVPPRMPPSAVMLPPLAVHVTSVESTVTVVVPLIESVTD